METICWYFLVSFDITNVHNFAYHARVLVKTGHNSNRKMHAVRQHKGRLVVSKPQTTDIFFICLFIADTKSIV